MSTENNDGRNGGSAMTKATIMPAGGQVVAVVPQSVEEIFRVAKGVVQSGLAPYALTGKVDNADQMNKAISAVATTIMSGAELGLPPMVSLRSFTVINGRPALYGDGLINVIRRSKMAKRLDVGFIPGKDAELGDDGRGYCEAERADTGEVKRVEFSIRQARRAGLWQDEAMVERDVWGEQRGQKVRKMVPNDSPWFRYPERMLGWRAAGFCLRELFGDVLGGITDDWEAREIAGPMLDVTPPARSGPPSPPPEPGEPKKEELPPEVSNPSPDANGGQGGAFDAAAFLKNIDVVLADAETVDEVEALFDDLDVQSVLSNEAEEHMTRAFEIRAAHAKRVTG